MQSLRLPPHASQVRGIFELNSPRRIYDEWMCLSQEVSVPSVESPNKYPNPDELIQMFNALSTKTLQDISNPSSTPQSITNQVFQTAQLINSILNNYSILVNLPVITSITESPSGVQLKSAVDDLETANANSVALLNQFTSHCEILANSQIPMRKYWNILGNVNNLLFAFMNDYASKLKRMFQIIPYDRVMQGISGQNKSNIITTPTNISTRISYNLYQNISQENPQIQALKESAMQLCQFIESFRLIGYTWKSTLISPENQNKCQSIAKDILMKLGVVDKMFDFYSSLPESEQHNITPNYQYNQIKYVYENMRSKINILQYVTQKFTLEAVYLHASSFAKQVSLLVRELRSIVDRNLISLNPAEPNKNDILNALKNKPQYPQNDSTNESNPYTGLDPQPAPQQPAKHASLKFSIKKKKPSQETPSQPGLVSYPKP